MIDPRDVGAQELIIAIFRLAVCDATGVAYGHEEPAPHRRIASRHRGEARSFIDSAWAEELADLGALPIAGIRRRLDAIDETADRVAIAS